MPHLATRNRKPRADRKQVRADIARRALRILRTEPQYVYHSSFDDPDAKETILAPPPVCRVQRAPGRAVKGSDFYVSFLYQTDLLTREEEFYLFRKMNYLKFRVYRLRQDLHPDTARRVQVEQIEALENEATRIRNYVIESNLRLVTARAKHFARTTGLPLDELISEGNIGLVQAVEHFDFSRGTKLSTYATWAISNKLLAYLQKSRRHSGSSMAEHGVPWDIIEPNEQSAEDRLANAELRDRLLVLVGRLKERERLAVEHRFGLRQDSEACTLKELAEQWGVTKQRAQQVCAGAVNKLRVMLCEEDIEPLGA